MSSSSEEQIIFNIKRDYNDVSLYLKENLDGKPFAKFKGILNGDNIEVERRRSYRNYKAIKFIGKIEKNNEELLIQGYFKNYYFRNFMSPIIMIILFISIGSTVMKVSLYQPFFFMMCLMGLLYLFLTISIAAFLIWKDKREIISFISNI
ncbi:hypothetical protein ACFVR2_23105 [Gottfriedia sp. NPDC057991]|uniref:hypothetical protein n=1 Tax=Gottfriedia sp. NPDC057991 TaxID=3346298 RepID=UPI0036DA4377